MPTTTRNTTTHHRPDVRLMTNDARRALETLDRLADRLDDSAHPADLDTAAMMRHATRTGHAALVYLDNNT